MNRRFASLTSAVVCLFLLTLSVRAQDPSAAIKALKTAAKGELTNLKNQITTKTETLEGELDTLAVNIFLNVTPLVPNGIDELERIFGDLAASAYNCFDMIFRDLETTASALLVGLPTPLLPDFMLGGCGEFDKFLASFSKELGKRQKKTDKLIKKIVKLVSKLDPDVRVNLKMDFTVAAPPKKLKIDSRRGGSDSTVANDGVLCVGGTVPPGTDVVVTITDPAGGTQNTIVTPNGATCRWRACFQNLAEGNYTIDATQVGGGQSANSGIGVP